MPLSDLITLSVVSHGHGALIDKLIGQLDELPTLEGVQVIVTLNVANEPFAFDTRELQRLQLTVIRNPSALGFGANHNQAFQRCKTRWFAILNPDLSLPFDVFSSLIEIGNNKQTSLIAPRIVNSAGRVEDSVRWNLTPWSLLKRKLKYKGEAQIEDGQFRWFAGMFYIVDSVAFKSISGFDTNYFLYCEDYDLCARMELSGHQTHFASDISVIHDAQRASWKSRRYLVMHLRSLLRVWLSTPVWRIALRDVFVRRNRRRAH